MANMISSHTRGKSWRTELPAVLSRPATIASHIVQRFEERRELNRLLSLPDYLLKDVGLQRHDIQRATLQPLWRD
jgi:uncharacterized protein YjiS (DUF1127 family)